jgi:hypothetical protein
VLRRLFGACPKPSRLIGWVEIRAASWQRWTDQVARRERINRHPTPLRAPDRAPDIAPVPVAEAGERQDSGREEERLVLAQLPFAWLRLHVGALALGFAFVVEPPLPSDVSP